MDELCLLIIAVFVILLSSSYFFLFSNLKFQNLILQFHFLRKQKSITDIVYYDMQQSRCKRDFSATELLTCDRKNQNLYVAKITGV